MKNRYIATNEKSKVMINNIHKAGYMTFPSAYKIEDYYQFYIELVLACKSTCFIGFGHTDFNRFIVKCRSIYQQAEIENSKNADTRYFTLIDNGVPPQKKVSHISNSNFNESNSKNNNSNKGSNRNNNGKPSAFTKVTSKTTTKQK
jgi:hypothetical protein